MSDEMYRGKRGEYVNPDAQLQAKARDGADDTDPGWIEGYVAVFGNVDLMRERIMKGAFAKTLKEKVKSGKVPLMVRHFAHGGDVMEVIGQVTEAKEDDHGLRIKARLSKVATAQDVRTKILEGLVSGLSVGYRVIQYSISEEGGKSIYNLLELTFEEATVTVKPVNELAGITSSKAQEPDLADRLLKIEQQLGLTPGKTTEGSPAPSEDASSQADLDAGLLAMETEIALNTILIERIKL